MSPSVDPSMSLHPTAMITQQMGQLSLGNTGPVSNSTHTNTNTSIWDKIEHYWLTKNFGFTRKFVKTIYFSFAKLLLS